MSGQIITTSAEVTLTCGLVRESPKTTLNSGQGIILICPDMLKPEFRLAMANIWLGFVAGDLLLYNTISKSPFFTTIWGMKKALVVLFSVYRGLYCPVFAGIIINHYKDPY